MRYEAVPIYPNVFGKWGVRDKRTGCFIKDGIYKGKGCRERAEATARNLNNHDERKQTRPAKPDYLERGNIFFFLFTAVALVGILGTQVNLFMRGPVTAAHSVVQHDKADTQILMAGRMVLVDALSAPSNACSSSAGGVPQPLAPQSCTTAAIGGGCLPSTGGPAADPWGTPYTYCAWTQGSSDPSKCPGLLVGQNPAGAVLVAIISAGKDRTFQTQCSDAPGYVTTPAGSDDIVQVFSPAESGVIANGIATAFVKLTDAPSSYTGQEGKAVTVNSAGSGLQFSSLTFSGLVDVPMTYTGQAAKFVRVKGAEDGLTFASASYFDLSGVLDTTFTGKAGRLLRVNNSSTGILFSSLSFRELLDVPGSYSGSAGKSFRINPTEDGLEYYDAPTKFIKLSDAPNSYAGAAGYVIRVKASADGLEFVSAGSANTGSMAFIGLNDAPNSYTGNALKAVRVKSTADGLEFYTPTSTAITFTSLSDAPASYSGQAGKIVTVNSTATGLQFSTIASAAAGALYLDDLGDAIANYAGNGAIYIGSGVGSSNAGTGNTALGVLSFQSATSATNNTFIGFKAGSKSINATNNTAVGFGAMSNITSGGSGGGNVAIGASAGGTIVGGSLATLVGAGADVDNAGSNYSTAMGYQAKASSNTVAIGAMALKSLSGAGTGISNTAVGYNAGALITTGTNNTIIGAGVGSTVLTTGTKNILIGTGSAVTTPAATTSNYLNIGGSIFGDMGTGLLYVSGSGALSVPAGTTAQRPTATDGMIRYNTSSTNFEGYQGGAWLPFSSGTGSGSTVLAFTSLSDAPTSYTGQNGRLVRVNSTANGLVFSSANLVELGGNLAVAQLNGGSGASSSTYWRGDGQWSSIPFIGLSGVPASYSGSALFTVRVNSTASGLEFVSAATAFSGLIPFTSLTDVPNSYAGQNGSFVRVNPATNGLIFSSANLVELGGNLAVAQLNGGSGASSSTYWRGDGQWSSIPFTGLVGVPSTYSGAALYSVRVNAAGNGLEFVSARVANSGTIPFIGLTDVPTSYTGQNGRFVRVNSTATGLLFSSASFSELSGNLAVSQLNSGSGASATTYWRGDGTWSAIPFIGLSGVPSTYSGSALYAVRVNAAGNGLEFYSAGSGGGGASSLDDLTDAAADYTNDNIYIGSSVGALTSQAMGGGTRNTAIGSKSLQANTSGCQNTAFGFQAAKSITTGCNNTVIGAVSNALQTSGSNNTAFGYNTGAAITTGVDSTLVGANAGKNGDYVTAVGSGSASANTAAGTSAFGYYALNVNTSGVANTALGYNTLMATNGGGDNTAVGYQALKANTTAYNNTAVGYKSLLVNSTGAANTGLGTNAGMTVTTGSNNLILGYNVASTVLTTGGSNILIGTSSAVTTPTASTSNYLNIGGLITGTIGSGLVAISGTGALTVPVGTTGQQPTATVGMIRYNTTKGAFEGYQGAAWLPFSSGGGGGGGGATTLDALDDVMADYSSTFNVIVGNGVNGSPSLTTGAFNTALGAFALQSITSGSQNTALGLGAAGSLQSGTYNTAIGNGSLSSCTNCNGNVAIGQDALGSSNAVSNTAIGVSAGYNTTGMANTFIGPSAGLQNTTGTFNTALGYQAGGTSTSNTTGSYNTFVGTQATSNGNNYSNSTALGNGATITASNSIVLGNSSISTIYAKVTSITAISDRRHKKDITNLDLGLDFIKKLRPVSYRMNDGDETLRYGFIAQEIETALPAPLHGVVETSIPGEGLALLSRQNNEERTYRVAYGELTAPVVKAIQEQSNLINLQAQQIDAMYTQISSMKLLSCCWAVLILLLCLANQKLFQKKVTRRKQ